MAVELNGCALEELLAMGLDPDAARRVLQFRPYLSLEDALKVQGAEAAEALRACTVEASLVLASDRIVQCYEDLKLLLPGGSDNVLRAWFGDPEFPWQDEAGKGAVCTESVKQILRANRPLISSCACLGCDPVPGTWKQFRVELMTLEGFTAQEPFYPKLYETMEEVPSNPNWVAFVRHAQAGHNVDRALIDKPDNPLTEVGVAQALKAKEGLAGEAIRAAQVVVTSPLTRAMQTAGLLLGESGHAEVDAAISERWSAPCDEGTAKSELVRARHPGLEEMSAWKGLEELPEIWWPQPGEDQWGRAESFLEQARQRPEQRIVFVGHGGFWERVLGRYLSNCEVVFCDRSLA
ncbi:unnamed protein product [Symbiodinium natans]|uniref:Uncharacterized protein n=1 Tax=Symbiodinium natans TaxID=878477 RepID=A0A812JBP1_9DINO|nr:unnamed protein product [Symbiodinium natans]